MRPRDYGYRVQVFLRVGGKGRWLWAQGLFRETRLEAERDLRSARAKDPRGEYRLGYRAKRKEWENA